MCSDSAAGGQMILAISGALWVSRWSPAHCIRVSTVHWGACTAFKCAGHGALRGGDGAQVTASTHHHLGGLHR